MSTSVFISCGKLLAEMSIVILTTALVIGFVLWVARVIVDNMDI